MKTLQNVGSATILALLVGDEDSSPLDLIERAGRTCYQSRDKITSESCESFARMLMERGHESVLEHSYMTVQFDNVSRGFTHELVRHRLAAFSQESTRYVDESEFRVVQPPHKDIDEKVIKLVLPDGHATMVSFSDWMSLNEQAYRGLRQAGWVPQDARQVLPIGIKSQIVMSANLREWRHVFKMRTAKAAHWEIRSVMLKLLTLVQARVPILFDDFPIAES